MKLRKNIRSLKIAVAAMALAFVTPNLVLAEISDKDFGAAMKKYLDSEGGQEQMLKFLEGVQQKQMESAKKKQAAMMEEKLEEQFKNPVKIDIGSSPVMGPADAPITLIEFSDYQCPFCKRGKETVDAIVKEYPGKIKVVFKHLPLPFHKEARPAAKASVAAGNQGKFWEMYEALFAGQDKLGAAFYEESAKKLGLNMAKFKADMESPATEAQVKSDSDQAQKLGIGGTPSFVVNGVEVRGAYPVDHFKKIIDRLLAQPKA